MDPRPAGHAHHRGLVPAMTRRGFTLAELLVALTLLGVLGVAIVGLLRGTQDTYRAQSQQIDVRENLRIASAFLPAELRELDAVDGDLVAIGLSALTVRAQRQLALLCRRPEPGLAPEEVVLTIRETPFAAWRDFNPSLDSVLVFSDGDTATPDDDAWVTGSIGSLSSDSCPDGEPGRRLTVRLRPLAGRGPLAWGVMAGAPVRGFETVAYRLYRSSEDGRWYVGLQSGSDLQPVLGPVTSDGLAFRYLDSSGTGTVLPSRVAMIEVRVRARTQAPIRDGGGRLAQPVDSVVSLVSLRNNRRF